jgi:hypothetical protein
VEQFFAERKLRAGDFAADVLSLSGKWEYVKGSLGAGDHRKYLEESFSRHVFRPEELKAAVESAVGRYLSESEGREARLLLEIRADLADGELAAPEYLPALASESEFREQFDAVLQAVIPVVAADLGADVAKELASMLAMQIAGRIVSEIGATLATELGLSGGILGTGATSGTVTVGFSLAAAVLVDQATGWAARQAGYDPEGEVAARVVAALSDLERKILDGPTAADFPDYDPYYSPFNDPQFDGLKPWRGMDPLPEAELKALYDRYWAAVDRQKAASAAHHEPGTLGLRHKVKALDEARSRLSEAALRKLILEGGDR